MGPARPVNDRQLTEASEAVLTLSALVTLALCTLAEESAQLVKKTVMVVIHTRTCV